MRQDLGLSARQAAEGAAGLTALAAGLGLTYRLEPARPVNSLTRTACRTRPSSGAEARRRGVSGVPSFVIADGDVVSGAQSPQALLEELRLAWRRATAIVLTGHPARAVVDGRELSFCTPTGLKTLLKARAAAAGVSFQLCHARGLRRVPTITGLDAAFPDSP